MAAQRVQSTLLDPLASMGSKQKQMQDARTMAQVVSERCARTGTAVPPYEFLELIGKGSFGRVYKCKKQSGELVAVKIIDVDELDYREHHDRKDEAIADFSKEVSTLKRLKDSKAKNINYIQEAFDLHSQLWIISDYCPGGSVYTLMKPTFPSGLEEKYIIPIARELAVALQGVHAAGIIHRDIKCGNTLISEDGDLQLCDFGVAGVVEHDAGKRSTIIGTPQWMPPEMHIMSDSVQQGYGMEVDCWAYGCTVYEMATGAPPNARINPALLRTVLKSVPRLPDGEYSEGLCDFVAFCLQANPRDRPSANEILNHPYLADSIEEYPTSSLRDLLDRYMQWERKGGQRASLFNPFGAQAPSVSEQIDDFDDWNFSTTDHFERDFVQRYSQIGIEAVDFAMPDDNAVGQEIPVSSGDLSSRILSPLEQAQEEVRARRGEKAMQRLFDPDATPYDYGKEDFDDEKRLSDLPLRNMSSDTAVQRESVIDLDALTGFDSQPQFNFDIIGDVPTLKANQRQSRLSWRPTDGDADDAYLDDDQNTRRATKDWKFPATPNDDEDKRRATKDWTFPSMGDQDTDTRRETKDWKFPLTMVASENPNRRTEDWTNTMVAVSSAARRTQDWTFATAEPADLETDTEPTFTFPPSTEDEKAPGYRPHLTRTATEPVGQFGDFLHPPAMGTVSADGDSASVRDSTPVIDLDFATSNFEPNFDLDNTVALKTHQLRDESPAVSTAGSTDTRRDPFFLGDVDREQDDGVKRWSGSSHRQSRSEGLLVPSLARKSRLLHSRGPSTESILRHNRDRGFSVSSSASSDVLEGSFAREYKRGMREHTELQLMNDLHNTAAAGPRDFDRFINAAYDQSPESMPPTAMRIPDMDDGDFPAMSGITRARTSSIANEDTDDGGFGSLRISRNRSRANTGATMSTLATSNGYDSSHEEPYIPPRRSIVAVEMPQLAGPAPEALTEDADADVMHAELDRMFVGLEASLLSASNMFVQRDRQLSGVQEEEDPDDMDTPFRGFTSGTETEGM